MKYEISFHVENKENFQNGILTIFFVLDGSQRKYMGSKTILILRYVEEVCR